MPETSAGVVLRYLRRLADDPGSGVVTDPELLQRFVAHRDETAFELLLWRHAAMVLSVCRGVLRDEHAAEDAFQATFLALARKASAIGRREALGGWLYQVAYRAALKARARMARIVAHNQPSAELDSLPAPAPAAGEWGDLLPLLHEELSRLPGKYRTPLVLCYLEGQTHADAARQIGWPKGTVSGRLARGREMLRQRLLRRGVAPSAALLATALTASSVSAVPPSLFSATVQGALAFAVGGAAAAGVSPPVVHLAEGVLHAMFLCKIRSMVVGLLVGCTILGAGLFGGWAVAQKSGGGPGTAAAGAKRGGGSEAGSGDTKRSIENLKKIALSIHEYNDVHSHIPGDKLGSDKKPLLSWRVLVLPFLGEENLYKQFKLDEPWDSEHNLKLLTKMPDIYKTGVEGKDATNTYYQGFADERGMFPPGQRLRLIDVHDGTSNTLLVIEAGTPVPWTKPADLPYTSNRPLPKLGGPFPNAIHAAFVDGSVYPLKRDFDEKAMRLAILRDDGEPQNARDLQVEAPKDEAKPPRKDPARDELQRALEEAAANRDLATLEAKKAEALAQRLQDMTQVLRAELDQTRARAEQAERVAQRLQKQAEAQMVQLKEENEMLKAALRKAGVSLGEDKGPVADDVKKLAAETERMQAELKLLRAEVERLKKLFEK